MIPPPSDNRMDHPQIRAKLGLPSFCHQYEESK